MNEIINDINGKSVMFIRYNLDKLMDNDETVKRKLSADIS